ncbi:MAG: hypothetical protein ABIV63_08955 [Caldimonas sp.]
MALEESPSPNAAANDVGPDVPSIAVAAVPDGSTSNHGEPIPIYRTRIPPAATLRYAIKRGAALGSGELQWRPRADGYTLRFETAVDGVPATSQSSEGGFDVAGLAPVRFLDRRTRRAALSTNFRRAEGQVSFSGSGRQLALVQGAQDRLSWMIQLAAAVAAQASPCAADGRVVLPVVGLKGEADVWTFRCAPHDGPDALTGTPDALRLVREGAGPYDLDLEVWLDPARHFLPVRVTLSNGVPGQRQEFELTEFVPAP